MDDRKKMEGDVVQFTDSFGVEHAAIVTRDFGSTAAPRESASVNVVYVTESDDKTDSYGRQIERATSVPNRASQSAPGILLAVTRTCDANGHR